MNNAPAAYRFPRRPVAAADRFAAGQAPEGSDRWGSALVVRFAEVDGWYLMNLAAEAILCAADTKADGEFRSKGHGWDVTEEVAAEPGEAWEPAAEAVSMATLLRLVEDAESAPEPD